MSEPLLAIDALVPQDRPYLTVNSKPYYFRMPSEFGILDRVKILRGTDKVDTILADLQKASEAEIATVEDEIRSLCLTVVEGMEEIIDSLTFDQQLAILDSYKKARGFGKGPANRAERRRARSTSGRSSQPSPASTEATTGS
jgi:hypothetical protein